MRLAVGGDHADYPLEGPVIEYLRMAGHVVEDFGTHSLEPVDFPDIAQAICDAVRQGRADRGILVCGRVWGRRLSAARHASLGRR